MDKQEAYNKALEKAKYIYNASECKDVLRTLKTVFPELAESEDERIKKAIIESLPKYGYLPQTSIKVEDAIAWLKKQGEQKFEENIEPQSSTPISYGKELEAKMHEACDRFFAPNTDPNRYSAADLFYAGVEAGRDLNTPAWNKEDEIIKEALIDFFNKGAENEEQTCGVYDKDILDWLKKHF